MAWETEMAQQRATTPSNGGTIVIGHDGGALGIVRSLGRRGIPVWHLEESAFPDATQAMRHGTLGPLSSLGSFRPPIDFAIFAPGDPVSVLPDPPLMLKRVLGRFWSRRQKPASDAALGITGTS